jgi:hypothetical protein
MSRLDCFQSVRGHTSLTLERVILAVATARARARAQTSNGDLQMKNVWI